MKKALFINRDGTIVISPGEDRINDVEKLEFCPRVIVNLYRISHELGYELILIVTPKEQEEPSFAEERFWTVQNKMLQTLKGEGIFFSEILINKEYSPDSSSMIKALSDMLKPLLQEEYDSKNSFVIGDQKIFLQLAKYLQTGAVFFGEEAQSDATLSTPNWEDIYSFLRFPERISEVSRNTNETTIRVRIDLDGHGQTEINTGLGFFDHMLGQLAKHVGCDLIVQSSGDLAVDEHHTVEDTALCLGEAFYQALGDKRGIQRYGFLLPMDDSLAQIAVDFSGRNWIEWNVEFKREKIGDMPTEMFYHFFKSFSDTAKCNLNIQAEGKNEHHKIEAIFKAFGRAIQQSIQRTGGNQQIPSTKGIL